MASTNTLTWDLVARDKSVTETFNKVGKAGEGLGDKLGGTGDEVAKKFRDTGNKIDSSFRSAFRKVSSDLDKLQADAWASGDKMDEGFVRAADDIRQALQGINSDARKTGATLSSELGDALRKVRKDVDQLGGETEKTADEMESSLGDVFEGLSGSASGAFGDLIDVAGSAFKGLGGAALAAGALLGGAIVDGIMSSIDQRRVGGTIAASIGEGSFEAAHLGSLAGDIYAANFGESLEQVGEAITAVFQNKLVDADATNAEISRVAEAALTVSTLVGESLNDVSRNARQLLVNGLADNVTEAMDQITHASQIGLNTAGDLLDTINEYSPQFARLGLDGAEAFGLLSQAIEGGSRDTDYAADALKEFAIRAQDMSVTTARGFRTIGLDADKMGQMIAAGGSSARSALDSTLKGLQAIHDPVLRNNAAVDLFGTKAEDLGQALFDMDLDTAAEAFGDFAGATEDASDTLAKAVPIWEAMGRNITGFLTTIADNQGIIDDLAAGLDPLTRKVIEASDAFDETGDTTALEKLKDEYPQVADAVDEYIKKKQEEKGVTADTTAANLEYIDTIAEMIAKQQELAGGVIDLSDAQNNYFEAIDSANAAIEENGANLDRTTEAGRDNWEQMTDLADVALDVAASMDAQGYSAEQVKAHMQNARGEFLRVATQMGLTKAQANDLANKLGLIPGDYRATVRALGIPAAKASLQSLRERINTIPRNVDVRVNLTGNTQAALGLPTGGFNRRAEGGPVRKGEGYWVGEEGKPEWFQPDTNGMIFNQDQLRDSALSMGTASPAPPGRVSPRGQGGTTTLVVSGTGGVAELINYLIRTGDIRVAA